jgi:hypothetical protein
MYYEIPKHDNTERYNFSDTVELLHKLRAYEDSVSK